MRAALLQTIIFDGTATREVQRGDARIRSRGLQLESSDVPGRVAVGDRFLAEDAAVPVVDEGQAEVASRSGWLSATAPLVPIKLWSMAGPMPELHVAGGARGTATLFRGRPLVALPSASLLPPHCPFPFVCFHPLTLGIVWVLHLTPVM
jgi:hypothetical protein